MSKIFMYGHAGSANHGCEAIVKSTVELLKKQDLQYEFLLCSKNIEADRRYNLDKEISVLDENMFSFGKKDMISNYFRMKVLRDNKADIKLKCKKIAEQLSSGDVFMSIGGDNYCYEWWWQFAVMHTMARHKTKKTVLWSCSVNPENITSEMEEDLKKYTVITARESISYEALKKINENTWLIPDVAFALNRVIDENNEFSSACSNKKKVGINLSPLVLKYENEKGVILNSYYELIEYILRNTEMEILLIPHVVEENNDDRSVLYQLYNKYKSTERIKMIDDQDCKCLKGIISQCDFFVGARTHSTIAAYSSEIPTLVTGYSTKSLGIAKDIFGTTEKYVVDIRNTTSKDELASAFRYIYENEAMIKKHLKNKMPKYISELEKVQNICEILDNYKG